MIREWFWPDLKKKPTSVITPLDGSPFPNAPPPKDTELDEILPKRSFVILGAIAIALTAALIARTLYVTLQLALATLRRGL